MRMTSLVRSAALTAAAALALTACGVSNDSSDTEASAGGSATAEKLSGLRIMVPNSPGSGYDQTARAVSADLQSAGLSGSVEVFNQAGAGGTVGLARLINEKGKGDLLMQMGLGVVGASYSNKSEAKLTDTTPVAKLIEESEAIVVPKDSPYKTLDDLVNAWKANPGAVPVGGASNVGGPDHLTPMLLAKAVGLDAKKVNYVAYDGGGDLMTAVLGKKLGFAATGVSEVVKQAESGDVRVLAVTSEQAVPGLDAKPLKEQGVDLVFTNWRGLVAAPGITDADKQKLVAAVTALHGTEEWKKTLSEKGWTDAFIVGDEFKTFLTSESDRVAGVLQELGLV